MRKFLSLMIAVLMAVFAFGQSYGILVNGHTYYAGTHQGMNFEGFDEYLAHVQLEAGDYCQLYDASNEAAWAVPLNTYSVEGFTLNNDRYEVATEGCYDFYIQLKYQADQLYIGAGSNCGAGEEIGGGESDQMYVWNGIGTTTADDAIELGGAAEAVQPSGENIVIGAAQKGNWCIKINKKFDNGNYYAGIALDNAVNAGDTIKIAYFRTGASSTYVLGMDFSANKASVATTYQILTQGDPQVLESAGTPADSIFIVPEGVANAKYIRLYRNSGSTGVWIAKFAIAKKSGETPEPEPVDPKTGYALLVNGTDTIDLEHADPFEEYDQWFTDAAELHAGDVVKVYNYDTQAAWAIGILNPASSSYVSNSENGLVFSKDSIYTIYLKLKYELDEVYVAPFDNEGGEVPPVDPTDNLPIVSLAGTMNGWNASANLFVPAQDSLSASLKIELEAGLDSFKIVSDNRWLSLWGEPGTLYKVHRGWPRAEHVNVVDGANFLFEADVTGEYTFTWTYADSTLVVTFPEKGDDPVIDPKTGYALLVVGGDTIDLVHGEEFEGYDQWYTEAAELHAGDVVKVYNYDTQAAWAIGILNPASSSYVSNSENGLVFSKDSIYTIYVKFKYEADEVYVAPFDNEGGDVPPVVEDAKFYIAGTMTDWAANMVELVAGNGDTLSVSIPLEANSLYEFKVVRVQGTDTAWYGAGMDATMHYGNSTDWSLYGDVDVKLQTTKADDYLFIFRNNEAKNISVVIPEPCMGKYGIMLGETFVPAKLNEAQEAWTEYYIDSLELAAGATFTLYDSCALAAWIVNPAYMDEAYAFDTVGAKYTVTMDGIYNLYIKLIQGADELFVNNLSYVAPEPEKHYMVYGEAAIANGENWNENSDVNVMTTTDGGLTYTLTIEGLPLQALPRVYEFKIIEKGNNGIEYFPRRYGANASFHVEEAGIYTITYIYTVATENCVMDLQKTGDFEPTLANGYYLVGNKYNWTPAAERMFAANPDNEAEMVLASVTLAADDSIKVVYVENDNIVTWYPVDAPNYVVDANHAGVKDIYFRADYQGADDWFYGCIYIAANSGSALINTEVEKVAVKQLRNDMVIIRRGDREYTIMGQMVK